MTSHFTEGVIVGAITAVVLIVGMVVSFRSVERVARDRDDRRIECKVAERLAAEMAHEHQPMPMFEPEVRRG